MDVLCYYLFDQDFQGIICWMLICGMYVYVGIEDFDMCIDLMNQVCYFLLYLLVLLILLLFWVGYEMGMKCVCLGIFDLMLCIGMLDWFESYFEYECMVEWMIKVGVLEDSLKIWWDLCFSVCFLMLEMCIIDVCMCLEDVICIVVFY